MEIMNRMVREFIAYKVDSKLKTIDEKLAKDKVKNDSKLVLELKNEKQDRIAKADVAGWLDKNAPKANQLTKASHAPKYSHSDSKASAVFVDTFNDEVLVTTSCIKDIEVDFVGNGAVSAVAGLLRLRSEGKWLFEYILEGNEDIFSEFTEDLERRGKWIDDLSNAFTTVALNSHSLAKQLYFPVEQDYHLLSPLYASSMSYALATKIRQQLYGENTKKARDARKKGEACEFPIISFPMLGVVEYGGSKPQNISKLNSELRGRGYLLNCQPPSWESRAKLPQTSKEFWQQLERSSWRTLKRLREYLEKHRDRDAVSRIKEPRADMVEEIVSNFFQLSAEIRLLGEQITAADDWSLATELTEAEVLLLNPQRSHIDAEFKLLRERKDWPEAIGKQFGLWLNQQLKSDKLIFGDTERNHWARIIRNTLSQLRDDLRYLQGGV